MSDLNQCTFTGRLGRDPETRSFPSGDEITNIRLAVGAKWKDKQTQERRERTEWVSVIFLGGLSQIASQYLRKGDQVMVSGEMRTREWEQDGQKRYATEIRAEKLQMLGNRQASGQGEGYSQQPRQASPQRQQAPQQGHQQAPQGRPASGFDGMDDDIPF